LRDERERAVYTICVPTLVRLLIAALLAAAPVLAQSSTSMKAGLWETTITSTTQMQLPPEIQARIDAMTPQQQTMRKLEMDAMIDGGAPTTTTMHSCSTGQSVQDLMNQVQDTTSCKLTHQNRTGNTISFDIARTTQQGTLTGHSSFTMADPDHVSGSTHMTATVSGKGGSGYVKMDSTLTSHYLSADCGDVKSNTSVVVTK